MQSKHIAILVVVALAVGGASFYGGTIYAKSKVPTRFGNLPTGNFPTGAARRVMPAGQARSGGFTTGDVISKDAGSITIKLPDGGSRIVFYSSSTTVGKMTAGTMDDVAPDATVMVTGSPNADGSVTAQSIQLRAK